jgi:hypothetical protein
MKRSELLRVAMTPKEISSGDAVAFSYGMTLPEFVRALLEHAEREKPVLIKTASPRGPGRPAKRHLSVNGKKA